MELKEITPLLPRLYKAILSNSETLNKAINGGYVQMKKTLAIIGCSLYLLWPFDQVNAEGNDERHHAVQMLPLIEKETTNVFSDVPKTSSNFKSIHTLRDIGAINGYEDRTFKPQNVLTRKHVALLTSRLAEKKYVTLRDVREPIEIQDVFQLAYYKEGWFIWEVKEEIEGADELAKLYTSGVLDVDANNNISPNKPLTRGEMAKILVESFNLPVATTKSSFKDVTTPELTRYVETLVAYGITTGYEDGTFRPNVSLTRAHYAEFLYRTMKSTRHYNVRDNAYGDPNMLSSVQSRWALPVKSFMTVGENDTYTIVETKNNDGVETVNVQTYDAQYNLQNVKTLPHELPIFGTLYEGEQYNYIAYGQSNEDRQNKEVIRVVKYDRHFNRIDAVSLHGDVISTAMPFRAAKSSMSEQNGQLVLHASRLRYDGHQSQLTIVIDTDDMHVTNGLSEFQKNHVSHSFDQYVLFDGQQHVLLDHGDAYPRALVIHKGDGHTYVEKEIIDIPGSTGANQTGVSIGLGGFTQTNDAYVLLYNEIDHSKATSYSSSDIQGVNIHMRDIQFASISKDLQRVTTKTIASYTKNESVRASLPMFVPIEQNKYVVMWQESEKLQNSRYNYYEPKRIKYVTINAQGEKLTDIYTKENMYLSYMQPLYHDGKIHWYINDDTYKYFYAVDVPK
ncbi:hypothetical protein A6K76_15620 [Caryophanon latum]|uniref:SLH domain-containing protein n=2 Tax=Caryophanon latum TaxID=33977 RepID=A0A1C0YBE2_9BACL|nr:hypothetical protein A6K76_15620 [Caryophanon latum]